MSGIKRIAAERLEHSEKHDRTVASDKVKNNDGQLRRGARKLSVDDPKVLHNYPPEGWDKKEWIKMCNKPYVERLAVIGSLVAAEIDRIEG